MPYSTALFDMPARLPAPRAGRRRGFAGFKVLNADHRTDWIAYLGASYFRSADPFNQYGLSARGLAIDTATAGPEEFPVFTAFWLERDAAGELVVYALLEAQRRRRLPHRPPALAGRPGAGDRGRAALSAARRSGSASRR